ncbi:uncharacterized protein Dana_GF14652 [Drosophila ananassae]|uniref:BPTI/Kunitz inhibitor domain-containing protein n=1 Tax=Drosophila ananassae TaxID=7217 RepID=B3MP55_DROAN|nr:kunitz-type serine protease inhibitor bitisilin-2 [Drosophila ananassae]EDV31221.1 uncharacterized protein Dana_GF14652 [Drosophila ananassae]
MLFRLTQILCFGALVLLGVMQLAQAVATPNNNNNKPKSVAQPQPVVSTGNQPAIPTTPKPQRLQPDPKCLQPLDPGPCRMSLERYYYNKDKKACETFKYGGCRGNDNRWGFRQTCEEACLSNKTKK